MENPHIHISIAEQRLRLMLSANETIDYLVSTARNGVGERCNSEQTPRGWHRIRVKIGADCPENTVFAARRPTGEVYSSALKQQFSDRDWVLTRILWLCGLEPGKNRFGEVDTLRRKIYIHGTPNDVIMGTPASHGCIRMANRDIMQLFALVSVGTRVLIEE